MKITDDNPSALTALDRPNSYIGRSVPRRTCAASPKGAGSMSAMSSCRAWRMSRSCARRTRMRASPPSDAVKAKQVPGVIAGRPPARSSRKSSRRGSACSRTSRASSRRPQIRDRCRSCVLAGARRCRGGRRENARAGRGRVRAGRGELPGAFRPSPIRRPRSTPGRR